MLFIRRAPLHIFIRSARIDSLSEYLVNKYKAEIVTFEEGWKKVDEFQTFLFITAPGHKKTRLEDAKIIIKVPMESSHFLSELFNPGFNNMIEMVQPGPGIIIARVIGDGVGLVNQLSEKYGAKDMDIEQAICEGEADDSILVLTNTSLAKTITLKDLICKPLLINKPSHTLYREFRNQGTRLITQSLKDKQWYEMRINIYDSADHYSTHYERMHTVFEDLDIGMVLGETWTRDHALVLMSVLAYQVRLFSMEPPEKIKRILMGLEYSEKGKRFVDFDLYYRNRKVSKNDRNVRETKNETVSEIKKKLYSQLTSAAAEKLKELEDSISTG